MEIVLMEKWLSNREPLLTTAVVAKWLGIAPRTVCLWAECKEIPAIKIGRQWRFRESELWEWLRNPGTAKLKYHLNNRTTVAAI
jgi:excisionase family DNA binding protein